MRTSKTNTNQNWKTTFQYIADTDGFELVNAFRGDTKACRKYLEKIEKFGGKIEIIDTATLSIKLPKKNHQKRESIFIHILSNVYRIATEINYNKKSDTLQLSWECWGY